MLLIQSIAIPIYNKDVTIIVGDPYETQQWLTDTRQKDFSFNPNGLSGICFHSRFEHYIWFSEVADVDTIVHEIGHATFDILSEVGISASEQEAFCYLQGYIMKECMKIFNIHMDPFKQPDE